MTDLYWWLNCKHQYKMLKPKLGSFSTISLNVGHICIYSYPLQYKGLLLLNQEVELYLYLNLICISGQSADAHFKLMSVNGLLSQLTIFGCFIKSVQFFFHYSIWNKVSLGFLSYLQAIHNDHTENLFCWDLIKSISVRCSASVVLLTHATPQTYYYSLKKNKNQHNIHVYMHALWTEG